jgi:hypothetical protein
MKKASEDPSPNRMPLGMLHTHTHTPHATHYTIKSEASRPRTPQVLVLGVSGSERLYLKVKGIIMEVRKAGMAWDMSAQSTFCDSEIIMAPTRIRMGAVAALGTCHTPHHHTTGEEEALSSAHEGWEEGRAACARTVLKSGARKMEERNSTPTVTAVRPVRPPSLMPEADSTWMMSGEQPAMAATAVPSAVHRNTHTLQSDGAPHDDSVVNQSML